MDKEVIKKRFTYYPPKGLQPQTYEAIRSTACNFANFINNTCPQDSYEKQQAIMKIEEAVFWANAAIARHGGGWPEEEAP